MKEILQPIVDQVVQEWNTLYPNMPVSVSVNRFGIDLTAGRVIIDGRISIKGVGVTDGTFEIGNDTSSWDNPEEFSAGLTECLDECLLAHSQYQQNRLCREDH